VLQPEWARARTVRGSASGRAGTPTGCGFPPPASATSPPTRLSRRVRTKFDGKRLVGSDSARDLKIQLSGSHAERLLDKITDLPDYRSAVSFSNIEVDLNDPDLGPLRESLRRWGAFTAHGEQFTHHAQFVQMVISRYARVVESIEALQDAAGLKPGTALAR
jgi:hypothetical protein